MNKKHEYCIWFIACEKPYSYCPMYLFCKQCLKGLVHGEA